MPSKTPEKLISELLEEKNRLISELDDVATRNGGLDNINDWPEGQAVRMENLQRAHDRVEDSILVLRAERAGKVEAVRAAALDPDNLETVDASTRSRVRGAGDEIVDRAHRSLDAAHRSTGLDDHKAASLESSLSGPESRDVAEYIEVASNPHYLTAFQKRMADPMSGSMLWDDNERAAYRSAHEYAMRTSLILSGSTALLPVQIDPTIMLTSAGSTTGIRTACRQETTTTNQMSFVTSAGSSAEWVGTRNEAGQVADATPAVSQKNVPVYSLDVNAVASWEVEADALNFAQEMGRVLYDAASVAVDTALATGTGSGQPTGIITALVAAGSQSVLTAGAFTTAGTGVASVYALQAAVPARWQHNASFVMPLAVINATRQFQLGTSSPLAFPELTTGEGTLARRPLVEDSNVSADMSTLNSKFAIYGDLRQYVLVTRLGATISVIPQVGSNGRPTAANNHLLFMRVGADCLIPASGAIKYLQKS